MLKFWLDKTMNVMRCGLIMVNQFPWSIRPSWMIKKSNKKILTTKLLHSLTDRSSLA